MHKYHARNSKYGKLIICRVVRAQGHSKTVVQLSDLKTNQF